MNTKIKLDPEVIKISREAYKKGETIDAIKWLDEITSKYRENKKSQNKSGSD